MNMSQWLRDISTSLDAKVQSLRLNVLNANIDQMSDAINQFRDAVLKTQYDLKSWENGNISEEEYMHSVELEKEAEANLVGIRECLQMTIQVQSDHAVELQRKYDILENSICTILGKREDNVEEFREKIQLHVNFQMNVKDECRKK